MEAERGRRQEPENAAAWRPGANEAPSTPPAPTAPQMFRAWACEAPQPAGHERAVGPALAKRRRLVCPAAANQHDSINCHAPAWSSLAWSLLCEPPVSLLPGISAPGGNSFMKAESCGIGSPSVKRDSTPLESSKQTASTPSPCNSICHGFFSPQRSPKIAPNFPCLASPVSPSSSRMLLRAPSSVHARGALQEEHDELHQALEEAVAAGCVTLVR